MLGKSARINDAPGRYIEFCKSTVPSLTRLSGLKIVVDCANGATYHIAPNVFSELGAEVIAIANHPDGFNINQGCGSTAPALMRAQVLKYGADLGVGLDGDGDRLIMVNSDGEIVDGDQILYIIAQDRHQRGCLQGGVVGTLMSNYGLELAINTLGLEFLRTPVGDRYVLEALKARNWKIGGEPSGHVVCLDKTTTGDGIVAALQVLAIMIKQNKSLKQLCAKINLLPQTLINLKTKNATMLALNQNVLAAADNLRIKLADRGRVLLRPSGTEPILRVMVEGLDSLRVQQQAQQLIDNIKNIEQQLKIAHV